MGLEYQNISNIVNEEPESAGLPSIIKKVVLSDGKNSFERYRLSEINDQTFCICQEVCLLNFCGSQEDCNHTPGCSSYCDGDSCDCNQVIYGIDGGKPETCYCQRTN